MPMDIRKFFAPKGGGGTKKPPEASGKVAKKDKCGKKETSTSDPADKKKKETNKAARRNQVRPDQQEETKPSTAASKEDTNNEAVDQAKKKRPRIVLLDDDDDDDEEEEEDKKVASSAPSKKSTPVDPKKKTAATASSSEKKRKEVSVADFFSAAPSSASPRKKTKSTTVSAPENTVDLTATAEETTKPTVAAPGPASKKPSPVATAATKTEASAKPSPRKKAKTTTTKSSASSKPKKPSASKSKKAPKLSADQIVPQDAFDQDAAVPESLLGVTIVFSGVLDDLSREEATELVKGLGGRVTTGVPSTRTDYLVVGPVLEDGRHYTEGSKYKKATELESCTIVTGGKVALYGVLQYYNDLARKKSGMGPAPKREADTATIQPAPVAAPKAAPVAAAPSAKAPPVAASSRTSSAQKKKPFVLANNPYARKSGGSMVNPYAQSKKPAAAANPYANNSSRAASTVSSTSASMISVAPPDKNDPSRSQLWVDKYKPQSTREILGNADLIKKLSIWLSRWEGRFNNPQAIGKSFSNPSGPWKAALLSGPPGIGKTTTATLVAKESGRDVLEFNASDVRSKKAMKEHFGDITGSQTISFAPSGKAAGGKASAPRQKRCIIMDEVDGMGAGDRSGMAELIQMIKGSQVPIICICNDRFAQKIKSLLPYCMDLRYKRPVKSQIVKRAQEVARREGLIVEHNAAEAIAESCGNDVRQVLNALQMWASNNDTDGSGKVTYKSVKERERSINKDEILRVSLFDAAKIILEGRRGLLPDSSPKQQLDNFFARNDAFFVDYNFTGLLVQQNYLKVMQTPFNKAKVSNDSAQVQGVLDRMSAAADSISDFALAEGALRGDQNWSLLPIAGMFTVKAGYHASGETGGFFPGFPEFSSWLGKNSTMGKKKRLLGEMLHHCNFKISGGNQEMRLSYLPVFRERFFSLLSSREEGAVDVAIDMMDQYGFDRDDIFEKMDEFKMNPKADSFSKIDSKKKAAITRAYNSRSHTSQALVDEQGAGAKKKRKAGAAVDTLKDPDAIDDDKAYEENDEEEEDEDDKKIEALFKKKGRGRGKAKGTKAKTTKAKGRKK